MQILTVSKEDDLKEIMGKYAHLVDICQPPTEMIDNNMDWHVRDGFDAAGTLMVGDFRVVKNKSKVMEIHPFPEWVLQSPLIGQKTGKVYLILPKFSEKQIKKFTRREWIKRIDKIQKELEKLSEDDFIAIEYQPGLTMKVPANVPHDFISIVDVENNEKIPYCLVFEPNFMAIGELLKITTPYFNLSVELSI